VILGVRILMKGFDGTLLSLLDLEHHSILVLLVGLFQFEKGLVL
jgi:hypothetical protein